MNEELKLIISAEISQMKQELEKANKEVKGFKDKAAKAGKSFGKVMAGIGKATKTAMKVTAAAITAGATALVALAESTKEYRTAQAKLTSSFEAAGSSAKQAKETYNELYRVLGDDGQAVEAANHLSKLTTNSQELSQWTTICQGVYATFGDSLPIEGLTEAANETAKVGQVTGALADALNWAGVSEDAFNEQLAACNSEAEREALIRTTLNGLYSEAAATYEENAKGLLTANEAQAALTEGLAALGSAVEPIVTIFKSGLAEALATVLPFVTMVSEGLQGIVSGLDGGGEKLSEGFSGMISALIKKSGEMLPTVLTVGVSIVESILRGVHDSLPNVIQAVVDMIPELIATVQELLPDLIDMGIDLILALLAGATETIPSVITAVVDMIPELIDQLLDRTPELLEAAIQLFMALVEAIPEVTLALIEALPDLVSSLVETLIDSTPLLLSAGVELFMGLVNSIPEIIPALIKGLGEIVSNVGTYLIEGLKDLMDFDWELPRIKLPHFNITGKFSLNPPQIPKFKVSWYAQGGVFDKPTLFPFGNGSLGGLGEAGAEAVVPLEKNTQWLDRIAERLKGGAQSIYLMVDDKILGEVTVNSINSITAQTGAIPLRII